MGVRTIELADGELSGIEPAIVESFSIQKNAAPKGSKRSPSSHPLSKERCLVRSCETSTRVVAGRGAANVREALGARYRIVRNDANRHDQAKPVDHRPHLHRLAVHPIDSRGLWRIQRWN